MRQSDKQRAVTQTRWFQSNVLFRALRSNIHESGGRLYVDPRQLQRIRRFGVACLLPAGFLLLLLVFYLLGFVTGRMLGNACAILFGGCFCFLVLFVSGRNLQAADKNMTAAMTLSMLGAMLLILYEAPMTQIIYGPLTLLLMLAGGFRLMQRTLVVVACIAILGNAAVIAIHAVQSYYSGTTN
jgi:hypothetical protein